MGERVAAGEGLTTGLGLVVGGAAVSPAGEADGDEAGAGVALGVVGVLAGSQPATKAIARIVGSRSAVRLISFVFGLFIGFSSFEQDLKSGVMIARTLISNNGHSHRRGGGVSAFAAPRPSFSDVWLH
jgi:hypothetical protein